MKGKIVAALLTAALATSALAGPGMARGPLSIEEVKARHAAMIAHADRNGDGGVSLDEFRMPPHPGAAHRRERRLAHETERLPELFAALDSDGNGQLSADEFSALPVVARDQARREMFERLDENGDGLITSDDTPPHLARLEAMDSDGDGFISRRERRAAGADDDHDAGPDRH